MLDKEKEVQGLAIYGEFRKGSDTLQIIVTPDGYTPDGKFVPMKTHRRVVSANAPRSQWKSLGCYGIDDAEFPQFSAQWAEKRVRNIHSVLNQMELHGWLPVAPPLVVEASRKDMADISDLATPTKIIYRIQVSRTAAGYPAELFPAATTV